MNLKSIKEMFPDWKTINPTEWSAYGKILEYGEGHFVEIELYREPIKKDYKYSGAYTLQIFDGDELVFWGMVEGLEKELNK